MKIKQAKTAIQLLLIYTASQILPAIITRSLPGDLKLYGDVYGTIASFIIGALGMILLSHRRNYQTSVELGEKSPLSTVIGWGIAGLFLSLIGQLIAVNLEAIFFQLPTTSANTESLFIILQKFPLFLIVIAIAGPIMEEYIFRKILFGSLVEHTGAIGAAVISSLLFAFIHVDGHLLVYSSMGFVFCYVYMKTKNIAAPMIAHMLMNTVAILPLLLKLGR